MGQQTDVIKILYQDNNFNSVHLCKNNRIKICSSGRCISKPIEEWVAADVTYANKVLINRLNELEQELAAVNQI